MRIRLYLFRRSGSAAASASSAALASPDAVRSRLTAGLSSYGRILFDGRGFALYAFTRDPRAGASARVRAREAWPPYVTPRHGQRAASGSRRASSVRRSAETAACKSRMRTPLLLLRRRSQQGPGPLPERDRVRRRLARVIRPSGALVPLAPTPALLAMSRSSKEGRRYCAHGTASCVQTVPPSTGAGHSGSRVEMLATTQTSSTRGRPRRRGLRSNSPWLRSARATIPARLRRGCPGAMPKHAQRHRARQALGQVASLETDQ